jgi:tetratricopeptide (TPR) repeat protein
MIHPTTSRTILLAVLLACALAARAGGQQPDAAARAEHAKELMAGGHAAQAVPIYRELVREIPNNPGLVLDLGLALDMAGDKREAIRQYQAALRLDPNSFPATLLMGTAYQSLGQARQALPPLERAAKLQPENPDAQATLAEALLELDQFQEATERLRALAMKTPGESKVWYGLGLGYDGLAQQYFDKLSAQAQGSGYWLELVAESRLETKQTYSAFYFYRQALARLPALPGAHAAIAEIYRENGHPDWAAIEEQREKQLPPLDCASDKLGCEYQAEKYLQVVQDPKQSDKALYWKTKACNRLALEAYSRLAQLPPSVESHELKARIDSKRRQYAEAASEWREALKLAPGNPTAERELAIALYRSGSLEEARKLFENLLRQNPASVNLNYFLGDTILNLQQPRQSIPYLEKALALNAKFLPAQRSLGVAELQSGKAAQAIPHLRQALPLDTDGSLHYQLARAYMAAGQRDLAKPMLAAYQEMRRKAQQEDQTTNLHLALAAP